jgi:ubiquinone/menaquinone biosynthesis C-methylase UbiE
MLVIVGLVNIGIKVEKMGILKRLMKGKPVLDRNEHDADNKYWNSYTGNCTHLIAETDKHHILTSKLETLEKRMEQAVVLDLGCGVGRLNLWYNIKEYHGLDTSPVMLEKAKELNQAKTNATFHLGDGHSLTQFPDLFFDVIIANTVFLHLRVRTVEAYLKEIWRVLKYNRIFFVNIPKNSNLDLETIFVPFGVLRLEEGFKNDLFYALKKGK